MPLWLEFEENQRIFVGTSKSFEEYEIEVIAIDVSGK